MTPPRQAVILAGGTGTRLGALTTTMPKPMIPFHGKPFLHYLVDSVREQGFERVLLLLGYLAPVVQEYFREGHDFGVRIDYSVTDVSDETARRLRKACDRLDPVFFLMYCDNIWPFDVSAMWQHYLRTGATAQITVYANDDGCTKNNVRVDERGMIVAYDKSRRSANLHGNEIGYAFIKRDTVAALPDENVNFEGLVYPDLTARDRLAGYVTRHRYYSIGSPERLPATEQFLGGRPAVLLDRDGVLNVRVDKARYVTSWADFQWMPGAREAIGLLKAAGYRVVVITNQAGIARGMMTEQDLAGIHDRMNASLAEAGVSIDAFYYCPHGWDAECDCRKPKPGMLFQAQRDFHLNLAKTHFVGDDERDVQAGAAAGVRTLLVTPEWPLLRLVQEKIISGHISA